MSDYPEFDIALFKKLHRVRGETVRWWRAQKCYCYFNAQGTHDPRHAECGGTGMLRIEQNISAYKALIRGVSEKEIFATPGVLHTGDVQITTLPDEIPCSTGDYILLPSRTLRETQPIKVSGTGSDALRWQAIAGIINIRGAAGLYVQGIDYELTGSDPLGHYYIHWLDGGNVPTAGTIVSVLYTHYPLYEIRTDVGAVRRVVGTGLPQKVIAEPKNP
jgi:hypothetical protein